MADAAELSTAKRLKAAGRFVVVIHRPGGEVVEKAPGVPAVWKNTVKGRGLAISTASHLNRATAQGRGVKRSRVYVTEARRKAPWGQLDAWRVASRAPAESLAP